jgi:uncharacterized membrane protein YdbT with pleckstrin-like domain
MKFLFFPALFDNPANISFAEQEADEKLVLFLRQHPIVNVPWIVYSLLALVLPVIFIQIDLSFGLGFFSNIPDSLFIAALIIYYVLILGYVVEQFLHWYFNIYIVTNKHLVDVDFDSLLYRHITEVNLEDVESVKSKLMGVFASLFNYGDVKVETAAAHQAIDFIKVPKPDFVADRIQDLVGEAKKEDNP